MLALGVSDSLVRHMVPYSLNRFEYGPQSSIFWRDYRGFILDR